MLNINPCGPTPGYIYIDLSMFQKKKKYSGYERVYLPLYKVRDVQFIK